MGETVLGNRYEIIKKIGDGGMAFVYEARDKLLNRTVAIKVLRPEFVDDEEFLTKFKREAEAVASLSHPNIVNVYDVGEDGKVHYIVMELIEGQNLKDIIKNEGTLDEYTALDIAKQIAKALGAAHRKGIIHRDIKPHNILISNEGRLVKVADFGIAKAVSSSTITSTGSVIGSVHYFSPEQAKGKFVSNTTDLYSLGIVLYEMIIGRVPFTGESPISIALQHINEEIEFTQEEKVSIPQSVRNIIKKLTSKSSADRYQGADELIEDIEYIEKNIDLDFIKEYDNYATQKIDEAELNKALKLAETKPQNIYEEDDVEEELDNVVPVKSSSKRNKKKNKKEDNPKSKKRWKIAAIVLTLVLIIQIAVIAKIALGFKNKDTAEGTAPNLINMELDEAQKKADELGLNIRVSIEEYSDSVEKNHVISQTPNEGTPVNPGDTMNITISKGKKPAEKPVQPETPVVPEVPEKPNNEGSGQENNGGSGQENNGGSGQENNGGSGQENNGGSGQENNGGSGQENNGGSGQENNGGSGQENNGGSEQENNGGSEQENNGGSGSGGGNNSGTGTPTPPTAPQATNHQDASNGTKH
ncbi:Stk1 family PASTA domain-containing Ser/Thr kinase [Paraclostridium bifermentans]|nr:Stk1 family PASTA domain-containing Ser/Thr kinase [Paraclostridium bifermentans]UOW67391.1 Stk1 family PASTA domain-containing Ser/Thr kinase [Paraclostridium bifermentans]